MAVDEFSIIESYFSAIGNNFAELVLGQGDDAAVVDVEAGCQLVVAMDTLVSGVHFSPYCAAADIAHKALAVNLSDLAAMAAAPAWFQLSLTLPEADTDWLEEFAAALNQTATEYDLALIGGDTCRGPLSITIQVAGQVPKGSFVKRRGAQPGDQVVVSGELGNAALGLALQQGTVELPKNLRSRCEQALNRPRPRLELIPFLRANASAAIDISDGLCADLGHILDASDCGATLWREALPVNQWVREREAYEYPLDGGDDYEICCCVPVSKDAAIDAWNDAHAECPLTVVGEINAQGYYLQRPGTRLDLSNQGGYRHFA